MLEAFTHDPSPSMTFGIDRLAQLPGDVMALVGPAARVLIVTDGGLMATGLPTEVAERLRAAGHLVELFSDVRSDPSAASIDAAAARARAICADLIVGLGGGSPLDVAKLAACVAVADIPAEGYAVMARPLPDKPIKKILIPTTSGTGAEMTRTSVYGIGEGRKVWAWGPTLKADLSILDPMVTRSLPAPLTAATGLDALVHAIEACTHRRATPVVEGMALQAIRLVAGNLQRVIAQPGDLEARGRVALGSAIAGVAIDACGTGIAHAFGHALGTLAHVHHGRAVALAMRVALPWACAARPDLYAPVALALGVDPRGTTDERELAMAGATRFEELLRAVGLPVSLVGDGLGEADVARLVTVTVAVENKPMVDSNAVQPTDEDLVTLARAILTAD
ncbi:alcohol dehydrogenase [alpha proteobacterium BAL199]|jgi:alcohol dehydrogenase class IV|nr:alcohol dehydrogenase [alpha proteobacterium BAL199]